MKEIFEIETLEQMKAISNPIRNKLMHLFCNDTLTTKQAAERLGENPTKLYHHVDCLREAGFVKLVKTKQNRGTIEKYYKAVAVDFRIDPSLFNPKTTGDMVTTEVYKIIRNNFDDALQGIQKSLEQTLKDKSAPRNPTSALNSIVYLSKKKTDEFTVLMSDWLEKNSDPDKKGNVARHVTMVIYPVVE